MGYGCLTEGLLPSKNLDGNMRVERVDGVTRVTEGEQAQSEGTSLIERVARFCNGGKWLGSRKRKAQEMDEGEGITNISDHKSDHSDSSEVENLSKRRKKRKSLELCPKDDIENDADDESLDPSSGDSD